MRAAGIASGTLPQRRVSVRVKWFAIIAALLAVVAAANAHLIYVAIQSQPECVAVAGGDASSAADLRPAKPVC